MTEEAPTPPVVELRDIHLEFDEKKVLQGVSLVVEPLDRLVIMGQSGSGKSTILRLILGILPPTSGSVSFKQFEISRLRHRKLQQIRTQIGMVYQYSALLSSRSVRDNVALPLEDPELILFDEPSAGLDPVISSVIDELIISLTENSQVTSVIVTHEMDSAFRVGTKMAMLYQGKIIEAGDPQQLRQSENPVVAQFLSGSTEGPILEGSQDAIETK
ncbi:MAG: ATP-binding cassette domain-containing protein [Verrucomicrobiaceae bacterium]|nr:ATP-binding cassette domain-containing protein [Verrucomicrobiaceae bacterium]